MATPISTSHQDQGSGPGDHVDARGGSEPEAGQQDLDPTRAEPAPLAPSLAGVDLIPHPTAPAPLDEPQDPQAADEAEVVRVMDMHEAGQELSVDERVTHAWATYVLRLGKIHNYAGVKAELTRAFGDFVDEPPHLLAAAILGWIDNPKAEVITTARAAQAFLPSELTKVRRQSVRPTAQPPQPRAVWRSVSAWARRKTSTG